MTGSSSDTVPSSTSCMISVAVYIFVSEPIWNSVSAVAGSSVNALRTPAAASVTCCPSSSPTVIPGIR